MADENDNGQNDTRTEGGSEADDTLLSGGDVNQGGDQGTDGNQEGKADNQGGEKAGKEEGSEDGGSVPEGEYELEAPEGLDMDAGLASRAQTTFKELGLTQNQATSLNKMFGEHVAEMQGQMSDNFTNQLDSWVSELKADKEIGGDKFDENAGVAAKAIEKFGSPELKQVLNQTGMGNNPDLFRFALNIGRHLIEDNPGTGSPAGTETSMQDRLYGKTTSDSNG